MSKLSIITPTYNRASFLNEIYLNLLNYESDIFEWIIIDDGSTDTTRQLVDNFEKNFPIIYKYQPNSGKHIAVNIGLNIVSNQYTVILDSDDLPLTNAFNIIISLFNNLDDNIVGIAVNMCNNEGSMIGKFKTSHIFVDTIYNAYLTNKVDGDKWFIWKTNFIRNYKFPIFENEKFVPEGLLFNRISRDNSKIKFYPEILLNARYQSDGYSKNIKKLKFKNFNGFSNFYLENIFSNSISPNKYYLKSIIGVNMLILNKSKRPFIVLFLTFISIPILFFTLLFYKKFYYKPD